MDYQILRQISDLRFSIAMNAFVWLLLVITSGCDSSRKEQEYDSDAARSAGGKASANEGKDVQLVGRISGASMAPLYLGIHGKANCPDCNHVFKFDCEKGLPKNQLTCPLCGGVFKPSNLSILPADRILLEPVEVPSVINRWDVVAYKHESQTSIKRIIGLPYEVIRISQGDVWVNGKRVCKPIISQLETRVLLFDSNHFLRRQLVVNPQTQTTQFPIQVSGPMQIGYQHFPNYLARGNQKPEPVKDSLGYNQTLSRTLNRCHDLGCQLYLEPQGDFNSDGKIDTTLYSAIYGSVRFILKAKRNESTIRIEQGESELGSCHLREPLFSDHVRLPQAVIYLSVVDGRARVMRGVDGEKLKLEYEVELESMQIDEKTDALFATSPVGLDCDGDGSLVLKRLQIYRDVHYFDDWNREPIKIGPDHFFVVGDNVPVSMDSRRNHFFPTRRDLVGKVKRD